MGLTRAAWQPSLGATEGPPLASDHRYSLCVDRIVCLFCLFVFLHLSSGTGQVHPPTCLLLRESLRLGSGRWQPSAHCHRKHQKDRNGCVTAATANLRLIYSVLCVSLDGDEAGKHVQPWINQTSANCKMTPGWGWRIGFSANLDTSVWTCLVQSIRVILQYVKQYLSILGHVSVASNQQNSSFLWLKQKVLSHPTVNCSELQRHRCSRGGTGVTWLWQLGWLEPFEGVPTPQSQLRCRFSALGVLFRSREKADVGFRN